jgi:hypothetical protein
MPRRILGLMSLGAVLAGFACGPAYSAELGFYVGVNGAHTKKNGDAFTDTIADNIYSAFSDPSLQFGPNVTRLSGTSTVKETDTVYGFLGGWRWRPNLAFELGYLDLGETKFRSHDNINVQFLDNTGVTQSVNDTGATGLRAGTTGIALSALGIWPINYRFEIYGRAGVIFATNRITESISTGNFGAVSVSDSKSSTDFLAGAGASLSFLDIYQARLEFTRVFKAGDGDFVPEADVDLISLGITVTF